MEEYICADCGQRSDEDFCPLCEGKMTKIDDYEDDFGYMNENEEESEPENSYGYEEYGEESPTAI